MRLLKEFIDFVRRLAQKQFHARSNDLPYYATIAVAGVFFILALNAFVGITGELVENELGAIDTRVTDIVISYRSASFTTFLTFMTHMGDRYAYLSIGIAVGLYFFLQHRNWKFIVQAMIVMALSTVSNVVLKNVFNRQRPVIDHLVSVDTLSYPSGHSMSAMAFYGFLIYLTFHLEIRKRARTLIIVLLVTIILLVGISRIYLGVHFPSDVAAGYMGGLIWVSFCIIVFNIGTLYRREKFGQSST